MGQSSWFFTPLLSGGEAVGVIHVDSTSSLEIFSRKDLELLSVIANTMGPALAGSTKGILPRIPSIFISYSHEDKEFINHLYVAS